MYPNLLIVFNIAKETKLSTVLLIEGIEGKEINRFFSLVTAPENAIYVGHEYFGLPDYAEMEARLSQIDFDNYEITEEATD